MANSLLPAQQKEPHAYRWIHIDDFSPGIWDNTFISGEGAIISAPIGAAAAQGTFACSSIQGGALGPLPAITQNNGYPVSYPGTTTVLYETGFAANLALDDGTTELIIMLEGDDGTNHYYLVYSVIAETGSAVPIVSTTNTTTGTGIFGAAFPSWTRQSGQPVEGNPSYILPTPSLVWPGAVSTDANGNRGHVYCYPNPSAPTTFTAFDMVSPTPGDSAIAGPLFCYENRVIVFQGEGSSSPVGGGMNINENIGVTDPPQGYTYPFDFGSVDIPNTTILSAEAPWGYAAWGSVSVGELILIKRNGGAVIVNGDVLAPSSVIPLPAVESVGGNGNGLACPTSQGLIYCAQGKGAWSWNGGNTAQKISARLDDNFFNAGATGGTTPNDNYTFLCERWQNWVLFSNNYFYNIDTGGWWILYPNQSQSSAHLVPRTYFWWKQGRFGNVMYAAPLTIHSSPPVHNIYFSIFDSTVPTQHYQWQSLPIHVVPTADRVVDVRHVYLRLSSPDGSTTGTCTLTINGINIGTTPPITTTDPAVFRFNAGIQIAEPIIQLNCDNPTTGKSAPLVHSIDLEYRVRQGEMSDN